MSFLTINAVPFSVELNSLRETPVDVGQSGRSYSGTLRRSRQRRVRALAFTSTLLLSTEAVTWRGIINGDGHVWDFNTTDLFSCRGLAAEAVTDAGTSSTQVKFGALSCELLDGTGDITFPNGGVGNSGAVFSFWLYNPVAPAWENWVYLYNGAWTVYVDGALTASSPADVVVAVSLTSINIASVAPGYNSFLDDVVALPLAIPVAWITSGVFPNGLTTAYPHTPGVSVGGTSVPGYTGSRVVLGSVDDVGFVVGNLDGTRDNDLQALQVRLEDV